MKNKFKAFTIVELMVVLLLSAVIFSAVMLVIQILQQQRYIQEAQHDEVLKVEQLSTLLKKDAYEAKGMYRTDQQLLFDYTTYAISYTFNAAAVYRTILTMNPHSDTFKLPTVALETTWEGQAIITGKIDAAYWESRFFEQPYRFNLQKIYDHKTLLEQTTDVYTTTF